MIASDAFLENAFALDDQIVRPLETIEMDIPIHPLDSARSSASAGILRTLRISLGVFLGDQLLAATSSANLRFDNSAGFAIRARQVFPHFLAHEHRVRADVNDPLLFEQAVDQLLDLRINQRFAAADGDHRRVAFLRRAEAILQAASCP